MSYHVPFVRRDKFEPEDSGRFGQPCCWCVHRHSSDTDEPCRTCDHNTNAVPEQVEGAQQCPTPKGGA